MCHVGLRIDVDTLRGTRQGVPNLLAVLARHQIRATFFFSVGPDNMGRHIYRLLRPGFLAKMLRTRAAGLYGWDIVLRGTAWPGSIIGQRCRLIIGAAGTSGHEIGLHAWDHHRWQTRLKKMSQKAVAREIQKGWDLLTDILKKSPDCFAAPAWQVTCQALCALEEFPFRFQSDCRGRSVFFPVMGGRRMTRVQVPTTLPTYDEVIGVQCRPDTYNEHLLQMIQPDQLNVLTIHAEAEGMGCLGLFEDFLKRATVRKILFFPLGDILNRAAEIEEADIVETTLKGRDGWVASQA